jgi:hypothetical protein
LRTGSPVTAKSIVNLPDWQLAAGSGSFVPNGAQSQSWDLAGPLTVEEISGVVIGARILELEHGLYALSIAKTADASEHSGMLLPAIHLSTAPSKHSGKAEIISASDEAACWLGCEGGTVVIKAPPGGGQVLLTTYERRGQTRKLREITLQRIDIPTMELVERRVGDTPHVASTRDIMMEILLHIEGTGDRLLSGEGWVGARGRKLRLEAFSIRPLDTLAATDIEYTAYGPNGRETTWISGGKICGTRGLSLPLTGFAIRLRAHLHDRFGIEYHGAFFESGACGPIRDGEPCMAPIADDPLEAIHLRLFKRVDR